MRASSQRQKRGKSRKKGRKHPLAHSDNSKVKRAIRRNPGIGVAKSTSQLKRFKARASMTLKKKASKSRGKRHKTAKSGQFARGKHTTSKSNAVSIKAKASRSHRVGKSSVGFGSKTSSKGVDSGNGKRVD